MESRSTCEPFAIASDCFEAIAGKNPLKLELRTAERSTCEPFAIASDASMRNRSVFARVVFGSPSTLPRPCEMWIELDRNCGQEFLDVQAADYFLEE